VKRTRAARDALHNESRVLINQNGHEKSGKQEDRNKSGNYETMKQIRKIPAFLFS
jgi:hypothetical protein